MSKEGVESIKEETPPDSAMFDIKDLTEDHFNIIQKIFDINENKVDDIFAEIQKSNMSIKFITRCVEYALVIRPKQLESLISLLVKIKNVYGYKPYIYLPYEIQKLLQEKIIDIDGAAFDTLIYGDFFEKEYNENSAIKAILEDNINDFVNIIGSTNFKPEKRFSFTINKSIFYVTGYFDFESQQHFASISYMQLMAFYGSVKCLKHALLDGSFDNSNIEVYAVAGGNIEIVKLLEHEGFRFDNCFEVAVKYNRYEIGEWIKENYQWKDLEPCKIVDSFNMHEFFKMLNGKGFGSQRDIDFAFLSAIGTNNFLLTKFLFEVQHADINAKTLDMYEKRALHVACELSSIEIFKYLVNECHANIEEKEVSESTPLFYACWYNRCDIIKYLIEECKANTEAINSDGRKILHFACMKTDTEVVKYLIRTCNFNVEDKDDTDGKTAIFFACMGGHLETVKYLVNECHANYNLRDKNGATLLNVALEADNLELIKYIVEELKADVNAPPMKVESLFQRFENKSAIRIAYISCGKEIVKYLVEECHANVEGDNKADMISLCKAAKMNDLDYLIYLVEKCNGDLEEKDYSGSQVLDYATDYEMREYIKSKIQEKKSQ